MVEVKVCGKCGTSIPNQAIIDGEAKLVNGQLLCGDCAATNSAASAAPAAEPDAISLGAGADDPVAGDTSETSDESHEQITVFGGLAKHESTVTFTRDPHVSGTGAIRIRTFDSKLSRAAFEVLDDQINAWLEETGYEIKQVTANIGDIHGKTSIEPHLIINIWY
jgi:hypothetical protein